MRRALVSLALVLAAGCASAKASVKPAAASAMPELPPLQDIDDPTALPVSEAFDVAGPPQALVTLGMARPISAKDAIASAKKLDAYLGPKLGGDVTTRLYADAAEIGVALSSGAIDVAWLTPGAYVKAREKAAIKPIARLVRGGFTSYSSVVFVKAGKPWHSLDELQGKRMAWVGRGSASGRTYPRAFMMRARLDPAKFFQENLDLPDHKSVCQAVYSGKADAGATLSDETKDGVEQVVDGCREAGFDPKDFVIVKRFGPIPNDVIAVRADLPPTIEAHVRDALLGMANDEHAKQELRDIFHADAFAPVTDADFATVRAVFGSAK